LVTERAAFPSTHKNNKHSPSASLIYQTVARLSPTRLVLYPIFAFWNYAFPSAHKRNKQQHRPSASLIYQTVARLSPTRLVLYSIFTFWNHGQLLEFSNTRYNFLICSKNSGKGWSL